LVKSGLKVTNVQGVGGAVGGELLALDNFGKIITKIVHFRHVLAKI